MNEQTLVKRLRIGGLVLIVGLIVEAITLIWAHPLAFVVCVAVGIALIVVGIAVYLHLIVTMESRSDRSPSSTETP